MNDYLLADDLSGALEAGAAFRARGRRVTLAFGASTPTAAGSLQVLSSETRNASPAEAAAAVGRLFAAQRAGGGRLLFKKIDSTLRGPVGAEIKALIEALAPPLIVVCPANPAVGRTVRDGGLLVHGVPVADTGFRHDPGSPVRESRVAAVLAAGGIGPTSHLPLARLRSLNPLGAADGRGVLVSDAESADDLLRLVRVVREREPGAVFVGSGGLAHAIAAGSGRPDRMQWTPPRSVLIVCGSMSAKSRVQLEVLRDRHAVPLHEVGPGLAGEEEMVAQIIRSLAGRKAASLTVAQDFFASAPSAPIKRLMAVVTKLMAAGAEPEMLAATGGETARTLCRGLGIEQLELVGEIETGVVIAQVVDGKKRKLKGVIIKPGGFGSDEVWFNIIPGLNM